MGSLLRTILALGIMLSLSAIAQAQDKYSIHETIKAGDKVDGELVADYKSDTTTTTDGKTTTDKWESKQTLKSSEVVLEAKDGSATQIRIEVSPDSADSLIDNSGKITDYPCTLAGQTITLRRREDESIIGDYAKDADDSDVENLKGMLNPDEDFFPDKPVAVGDSWDISDKLSKHSELGKNDQLLAQCKLDWVKEIDGKLMGQMTCNCGLIRHEDGDVEEDIESTSTMLVDMKAGEIVKCDQTGGSKLSTPVISPTQITGTTEFTFHGEGQSVRASATQPAN
ncbi:MAG: hypothetical protein ABSG31_11110 [Tepidisphaeraceae bacterium]